MVLLYLQWYNCIVIISVEMWVVSCLSWLLVRGNSKLVINYVLDFGTRISVYDTCYHMGDIICDLFIIMSFMLRGYITITPLTLRT